MFRPGLPADSVRHIHARTTADEQHRTTEDSDCRIISPAMCLTHTHSKTLLRISMKFSQHFCVGIIAPDPGGCGLENVKSARNNLFD